MLFVAASACAAVTTSSSFAVISSAAFVSVLTALTCQRTPQPILRGELLEPVVFGQGREREPVDALHLVLKPNHRGGEGLLLVDDLLLFLELLVLFVQLLLLIPNLAVRLVQLEVQPPADGEGAEQEDA